MGLHPGRDPNQEATRGHDRHTTTIVRIRLASGASSEFQQSTPEAATAGATAATASSQLLKTFTLLLIALVLVVSALPTVDGWTYQYLYTDHLSLPDEIDTSWPGWPVAPIVSIADDQGSDYIPLPFTFPFYSSWRKLWIQPNGFLSLGQGAPPCCRSPTQCFYLDPATGCTLNSTDFTNVIMPSMTDLDASVPDSGNVYVRVGAARVDVRFDEIPLYHDNQYFYTFTVTLFATGQISFRYYNVTDPQMIDPTWVSTDDDPKSWRNWLVGLRGTAMTPQQQRIQAALAEWSNVGRSNATDANAVAAAQYEPEQAQWGVSAPGVYPTRDSIQNEHTIDFCFLATDWCLWPTVGGRNRPTTIYLTAHELSCASDAGHQFVCRYHPGNSTTAPPSGSTPLDVPATFDAGSNTLACLTPTLAAIQVATASNETTFRVGLVSLNASNLQPEVFMERALFFTFAAGGSSGANSNDPTSTTFIQGFCGQCGRMNDEYCWRDCSGWYRGNATFDVCSQCSGGQSGVRANKDLSCAGICFDPRAANRSAVECFCDAVYQSHNTQAAFIEQLAILNIYTHDPTSSSARAVAATDDDDYESEDLARRIDANEVPPATGLTAAHTLPHQLSHGSSPSLHHPQAHATLTFSVFSSSSLPDIHAGDIAVFRSQDLPQPVPLLCRYEDRVSMARTLESPMLYYEMAAAVFLVIAVLLALTKRRMEKNSIAGGAGGPRRGGLLPVTQSNDHHPAAPILHLPNHAPMAVSPPAAGGGSAMLLAAGPSSPLGLASFPRHTHGSGGSGGRSRPHPRAGVSSAGHRATSPLAGAASSSSSAPTMMMLLAGSASASSRSRDRDRQQAHPHPPKSAGSSASRASPAAGMKATHAHGSASRSRTHVAVPVSSPVPSMRSSSPLLVHAAAGAAADPSHSSSGGSSPALFRYAAIFTGAAPLGGGGMSGGGGSSVSLAHQQFQYPPRDLDATPPPLLHSDPALGSAAETGTTGTGTGSNLGSSSSTSAPGTPRRKREEPTGGGSTPAAALSAVSTSPSPTPSRNSAASSTAESRLSAKQAKAAKKMRRARRAALKAAEERETNVRPVHSLDVPDEAQVDDLPAISEILEEHRAANAGFGGLVAKGGPAAAATTAASVTSAAAAAATAASRHASALPTPSGYKTLPPSGQASFSKTHSSNSGSSHTHSSVAHPSAVPPLTKPAPSQPSPPLAPFSFERDVPASSIASASTSTWSFHPAPSAADPAAAAGAAGATNVVAVPEVAIASTYWPRYDTNEDAHIGYRYVRGGSIVDEEDDSAAPFLAPSLPAATAAAAVATPFQFDLSGFRPGVTATPAASTRKMPAPVTAHQAAFTAPSTGNPPG